MQCDRRVPEVAHQLHLARIVPDIRRDDAAGPRDPRQFSDRQFRLRHEVERQPGDGHIAGSVWLGQRQRVTYHKAGLRVTGVRAREGDEVGRAVNPLHASGRRHRENCLDERTRAAANIQPVGMSRRIQPRQEFAGDKPTPAANIQFIHATIVPAAGGNRTAPSMTSISNVIGSHDLPPLPQSVL